MVRTGMRLVNIMVMIIWNCIDSMVTLLVDADDETVVIP